jgi:hypothetical protein
MAPAVRTAATHRTSLPASYREDIGTFGAGAGGAAQSRRPSRATPPRRVSGPARGARRRTVAGDERAAWRRIAARAGVALLGLPDHRLLDRLVRGRYWIAIVGCALIGMVALQVSMLRLDSDIGRSVARASSLERENAALAAAVSDLATVERIEAAGARLGLVMPRADGVRYLSARPAEDAVGAVTTMGPPGAETTLAGGP